MLPDDRVDLRQPLDLSSSQNMSMSKNGMFSSRLSCCSDSSNNRELNLSGGDPHARKYYPPRPLAQTPQQGRKPQLKSKPHDSLDFGQDKQFILGHPDSFQRREIEQRVSEKLTR